MNMSCQNCQEYFTDCKCDNIKEELDESFWQTVEMKREKWYQAIKELYKKKIYGSGNDT